MKAKYRLSITAHPPPFNGVFHEKLIVSQTTNIFYSFYGIRRPITVIPIVKPTICTSVSNLFILEDTLHVSGGFSVHHLEFKTVHTATGICQTGTAVYLLAGTR